MSANLILYTNPMSRGQIARWMLEEVGQPYEQHLLEYGTTMKAPDYLAVNPMGKVPAIRHITDKGDHIVTECAAICAYLADAFPQAGLAPDPADRHDYYRWMFFGAGPVEQAVTNNYMKWQPTDEQQRMLGYGCYERVVDVLEGLFDDGRTFICGDRFTAADVYLGAQIDWGMQFGTLPRRASLEAYAARLHERPAYKKAKQIDGALIAEAQARQVEPAA